MSDLSSPPARVKTPDCFARTVHQSEYVYGAREEQQQTTSTDLLWDTGWRVAIAIAAIAAATLLG